MMQDVQNVSSDEEETHSPSAATRNTWPIHLQTPLLTVYLGTTTLAVN